MGIVYDWKYIESKPIIIENQVPGETRVREFCLRHTEKHQRAVLLVFKFFKGRLRNVDRIYLDLRFRQKMTDQMTARTNALRAFQNSNTPSPS